jgi:hypothetical protein
MCPLLITRHSCAAATALSLASAALLLQIGTSEGSKSRDRVTSPAPIVVAQYTCPNGRC